jgi:hypothetical protein
VLEPTKKAVLDMNEKLDKAKVTNKEQPVTSSRTGILQYVEVHTTGPQKPFKSVPGWDFDDAGGRHEWTVMGWARMLAYVSTRNPRLPRMTPVVVHNLCFIAEGEPSSLSRDDSAFGKSLPRMPGVPKRN